MRILLADGSNEVRSALRLLLEQQAGHMVSGEARDAINLLAQAARCCPEAIILDTELPGIQPYGRPALRSLVELIMTLRLLCPQSRIVTLSRRPKTQAEMLETQADGQMCKSDPPEVLLAVLDGFRTA